MNDIFRDKSSERRFEKCKEFFNLYFKKIPNYFSVIED